jgi:dipeptidyl aminopeptidase/acylaminoacyl peptidase
MAEPLPAELFARDFAYERAALSPSGSHIAFSRISNGTTNLAVLDLEGGKARALTSYVSPARVDSFFWKSDKRLIFGSFVTSGRYAGVPLLSAINADGGRHILILENPQWNYRFLHETPVDPLWEDPRNILLASSSLVPLFPVPYLTNVDIALPQRAAKDFPTMRKPVAKAPGRSCRYITNLRGEVRLCITREEDNSRRVLYRAKVDSEWKELGHYDYMERKFVTLGFAADNRRFYVTSNVGRRTLALFLFDPDTSKLGEPVFQAPEGDVIDAITSGDGRRLLGVEFQAASPGFYYLDEIVEATHLAIIKALPKLQTRFVNFSAHESLALVKAESGSSPGAFYLSDSSKGSLKKVLDVAPWIDPGQMGTVKSIRFDGRDGTKHRGYLTLPRGTHAEKLPLIVGAHGGPFQDRHRGAFHRESQFLASRGYAVLNLNVEGVDVAALADAARWAVAQDIADPARIATYGANFGGYLAVMALASAPETFKCALTYGGISDLNRMVSQTEIKLRDVHFDVDEPTRRYWAWYLGDRNEAALRELSPLHLASRIKAPVFIAHGAMDSDVPVEHSTELNAALLRNGGTAELFVVPNETGGVQRPQNRQELYQRMEAFLVKHLPSP